MKEFVVLRAKYAIKAKPKRQDYKNCLEADQTENEINHLKKN